MKRPDIYDWLLALRILIVVGAIAGFTAVIGEIHDARDIAAAANARAELANTNASVALAIAAARRPSNTSAVDLLAQRTEWLREVMLATCTRDGFGQREHLPDPPQGWPPIAPAEHSGPWEAPP